MGTTFTPPQELLWTKADSRRWDLFANNIRYATLEWRTSLGSMATGETIRGRWTFKRVGFFRPAITVRKEGSESDIAVMRRTKRGEAVVEFITGQRYTWRATKRVKRERGFYDRRDRLMLGTIFERKMFSTKGMLKLEKDAAGCPDLPILVLLAWHRLVLEDAEQQMAIMAGATSAAIS